MAASGVLAQGDNPPLPDVTLVGSGQRGFITYGETVTGTIERSETGSDVGAISYVGHNGANRAQGDFDVWYFDAAVGDNAVITVTADDGDLVPTLLIIREARSEWDRIPVVAGWDTNVDGDATAGFCLRSSLEAVRTGIIVFGVSDTGRTGAYRLTLEKAADAGELRGGSQTAICRVGTFVETNGDYRVNIRAGDGLQYQIKGQTQPEQPYLLFGAYGNEWTHILFLSGVNVADGYVKSSLIHITGAVNGATSP